MLQDVLLKAAMLVVVASTARIIFIVPDSLAASPRKVVGGDVVGVIVGSVFSATLMIPSVEMAVESFRIVLDVIAALSVGINILGMVATNTEHPPAAGTALGFVVHGWSISSVVFIISGATALSVVRVILRPRLVNLL